MDSPRHGHFSPVAESPASSRPADNGPSCKGPDTSSPAGTTQDVCHGRSSCALKTASRAIAPGHYSKEAIDQQLLQQPAPLHAHLQQQQHERLAAHIPGEDDDRQSFAQVAALQGQGEPYPDQQDQSDSDSQHSELSECESAGAVGDDELLDHEADITRSDANAQGAPADQPGYSTHLRPAAQHGYPLLCGHTAEQDCAGSNSQIQGRSSMMTQHQQESPRALPHHFVTGRGFAQQQRPAAYPPQWPHMASIVRHGQVQAGLGRGRREEHVGFQGSKLREAYQGHCQQDHQRQAEAEQHQAQHGLRQNSGTAL